MPGLLRFHTDDSGGCRPAHSIIEALTRGSRGTSPRLALCVGNSATATPSPPHSTHVRGCGANSWMDRTRRRSALAAGFFCPVHTKKPGAGGRPGRAEVGFRRSHCQEVRRQEEISGSARGCHPHDLARPPRSTRTRMLSLPFSVSFWSGKSRITLRKVGCWKASLDVHTPPYRVHQPCRLRFPIRREGSRPLLPLTLRHGGPELALVYLR